MEILLGPRFQVWVRCVRLYEWGSERDPQRLWETRVSSRPVTHIHTHRGRVADGDITAAYLIFPHAGEHGLLVPLRNAGMTVPYPPFWRRTIPAPQTATEEEDGSSWTRQAEQVLRDYPRGTSEAVEKAVS